jgi:enoyl-CoA hydratase
VTLVEVTRTGAVAVVSMNRPPVNAITPQLLDELGDAFRSLSDDASVRAVVLRSALERAFMAGADISMMAGGGAGGADPLGRLTENLLAVERIPKPVIAAVNGHALGGGCELALCCDYRMMVDDGRSTIGLTETSLGLIPGGGGTQRLPRVVGFRRALHLILEARRLQANEAHEAGLVDSVHSPAAFEQAVMDRAQALAGMATRALGEAKLAVLDAWDLPLHDGLAGEQRRFTGILSTADAAEGMGAFLQKRPPAFTGS